MENLGLSSSDISSPDSTTFQHLFRLSSDPESPDFFEDQKPVFDPSPDSAESVRAWDDLIETERQYLKELQFVKSNFEPILENFRVENIIGNWNEIIDQS